VSFYPIPPTPTGGYIPPVPDPTSPTPKPDFSSAVTLPEPKWTAGAWLELFRVRHLQWSPYTLPIPNLSPALAGLRVLHLTDLHVDTVWMPSWDRLLEKVQQTRPDVILITGDFVEIKYDSRPVLPNLRRLLDGLSARLGVWGILGNHDGDVMGPVLADMNVRLLTNELVTLTSGDASLELIGVLGISRLDMPPRVRDSIPPKAAGATRIVMAHYPDQIVSLASLNPDIFLAGHTHGGQVCLPGGWPLMTHDSLPRRFARGVHRIGQTWLSVGRGLTYSTYPIRTFCPAEAIELTLAVG